MTHGHGDHYGGVRHLVERYRPRVVMSAVDWAEVARPVLQLDAPHWGRPPARDIAVRDGHRLRLGDTIAELPVMRTHSPGTISPMFTVRDGRDGTAWSCGAGPGSTSDRSLSGSKPMPPPPIG